MVTVFVFLGFFFSSDEGVGKFNSRHVAGFFFLTVGGFFLNKELKLNDSSCQTKV